MKRRYVYVLQMGALFRLTPAAWRRALKKMAAGDDSGSFDDYGAQVAIEGTDFHHTTDWDAETAQDALEDLKP